MGGEDMIITDDKLDLNKLREIIDVEIKSVKKSIDYYNKVCREYSIRYANLLMIQDKLERDKE
jgi:hypothetical protein